MSPDDPRHGTRAGFYVHQKGGEKACADCLRATAGYEAKRRYDAERGLVRNVSATGTARRLQALVALGYTFAELSREMGSPHHSFAYNLATRRSVVRVRNAEKVDELYERLSMTPAPKGRRSAYARTVARKNGWAPPLAWDDIDDPTEAPKGVGLGGNGQLSRCRSGRHEMTGENVYERSSGIRECRACKNERQQAAYRRSKGTAA